MHCAKSPKTDSILTTNFDNLMRQKNDNSINELRLRMREHVKNVP